MPSPSDHGSRARGRCDLMNLFDHALGNAAALLHTLIPRRPAIFKNYFHKYELPILIKKFFP